MRIAASSVDEVLAGLRSARTGLAAAEARRRLAEFGPNRVEELRGPPLALRFAREFTHFFALVLWVAALLSFVSEAVSPGQGMLRLGVAIVGVILINGAFSFWQEYRAERAVAALRALLPPSVKALRDGNLVAVDAAQLVPGDVILLGAGDRVPADCRLIEAYGLRVSLATISGESVPKARSAESDAAGRADEARNLMLAGTTVLSGEGRAVVYATGMHTEFGGIAHLTQTAGVAPSPLQREIARLSRLVALLSGLLAVAFFFIGQSVGLSFWESLLFGIGILVANVPEGLLPTVTLSLAMATQRMARRRALVRHLPAVEALGATTVICCDKTGTLTENRMTARHVYFDRRFAAADAQDLRGAPEHFLRAALLCHSAVRGEADGAGKWVGDPLEVALIEMAARAGFDAAGWRKLGEFPFEAERRRMSVIVADDGRRVLYCKGAPESVMGLCDGVWLQGRRLALDEATGEVYRRSAEDMAAAGLRVLAFACHELADDEPEQEAGLTLLGLVGLEDPPRAEVAQAVARCREAGIRVIMVTGDHPRTAVAIGREIGLLRGEPLVVTGDILRRMAAGELQLALDAEEVVFARVAAEQKRLLVEALQRKGEVVAVTGDGVNDAPALKRADVGIAMGLAGTDVAKEAADVILLDDHFATIVNAVEEGRAVFDNIRKFLTYILTSNIPEIIPYLAFVLFKIPLPLTVIQILAVDLGTDMLPALALGAEKPDPQVMRRPPRARGAHLVDRPLVLRAYLFLGLLEAALAMAAFFFVLDASGWRYGETAGGALYREATTACLAGIVLAQVVNVFLCRHPRRSLFAVGLGGNRLLWAGVAVELALLGWIVYTPSGNWLFGTAPLRFDAWLYMVPGALLLLLAEEGRKALLARRWRVDLIDRMV
ncbi:MAG: cation-translocating P-type ATPase [Pseudomonadota bacterium]